MGSLSILRSISKYFKYIVWFFIIKFELNDHVIFT